MILVGPNALVTDEHTARIQFGADVRTAAGERVGEVRRVVVDLEQQAIVGIVALGRGVLARDMLVPLDLIDSATEHEVQLRLTREQVEQLPDFV